MSKVFSKTRSESTKLKIKGYYNANTHTFETDDGDFDVLKELEMFDGEPVELSAVKKYDEDLSDE